MKKRFFSWLMIPIVLMRAWFVRKRQIRLSAPSNFYLEIRDLETLLKAFQNSQIKISPWLTVEEAAAYARICRRTLSKLIADGKLNVGGSGHKILINRDHLDRQIEQGYPSLRPRAPTYPRTRGKGITRVS